MARKITEISLSQTFLGDFLISVHSIYANSPATMVAVTKGGTAYEAEILCRTKPAGMAAYH